MKTGDKEITFWEALRKFPPYYVRILAKRSAEEGNLAISDAELAIASGIPISRVREIARLDEWDSVTVGEVLAFTAACCFDPTKFSDRNRVIQYEYVCKKRGNTPFRYLRRHPKWESEFLPLIKMLKAKLATNGASLAAQPIAR